MSDTIHLSGLGSGLDVEGIIEGLVKANSVSMALMQHRASTLRSAVTTLSDIGTKLSSLGTALAALDTQSEASGYTATSSSSAIVASAQGTALPGSFQITVDSLAAEQRTYSKQFASSSAALGQVGSISIQVGTGTPKSFDVVAGDSLESIASKINALGLRASASIVNEGSTSRLQIRGLDTGIANALTINETGTTLDLNGTGVPPEGGKTIAATDAVLWVDGFQITRSTNQITGAIQGVTLALKQTSATPVTVSVASDPTATKANIKAMVSAFNTVISSIHFAAGYGSIKATNQTLSGDSALRTIADRLTSTVSYSIGGSSVYQMLSQVGVSLTKDGTLSFDESKFDTAVAADASGVSALVADRMAAVKSLVSTVTASETGTLTLRSTALSSQAEKLEDRAEEEQTRLDRYADQLRKQFIAMDDAVSKSQALMDQLTRVFG
jgi:flagellar hook-associated protein 2